MSHPAPRLGPRRWLRPQDLLPGVERLDPSEVTSRPAANEWVDWPFPYPSPSPSMIAATCLVPRMKSDRRMFSSGAWARASG